MFENMHIIYFYGDKQRIEEFQKSTNNVIADQLHALHQKLLDKKIFRLIDVDQIFRTYTALNDDAQKKIRNAISNGKYIQHNILFEKK